MKSEKKDEYKLPPNDEQAEAAVIGSLLLDGVAIHQIEGLLSPSDFFYEQNRFAYQACFNLNNRSEVINQVTVAQELTRLKKLEAIGGAARLSYLISICPTSLDIESYANVVHKLSVLRQLITAGDRISAIGYLNEDKTGEEALAKAEEIINSVSKKSIKGGVISSYERGNLLMEHYTKLKDADNPLATPTGFTDVDAELGGGIMPAELTILLGDSGHGKSTLAHDIAINVGDKCGDVLYLTSEMSMYQYSDKEVAKLTCMPPNVIRAGRYDTDAYAKIVNSLGVLSERPIHFSNPIPFTMASIRQAAYRMSFTNELKLIVVDSLNKISIDRSSKYRHAEFGYLTTDLKTLAGKLEVPILVIGQLNRDVDKRLDKRPVSGDIYESDQIYQDADIVLFLYRIEKYWTKTQWDTFFKNEKDRRDRGWAGAGYENINNGEYPAGIAEIIIEKQRVGDGVRKIRKIVWDKEHQSYKNLARG